MKLSSLGDIVHALPAVSALRQRFPHARLTWLVKEVWAPILEGNPDIDDIVAVNMSWRNWLNIIRTLRRGQFDLVVDFQGLFRSGILGVITGARTRVGFARAREGATWFYTHHVPLPEAKPSTWRLLEVHAVDRNLALTTFLGGLSSTPVFHLPQFSADRLAIETMLQGANVQNHELLIALAPWTRSAMKSWPFRRFVDLATELVQWPNVRVVLLGGPSEISASSEFDHLAPQGLMNLVGRLSLRQLPSLLRRMQLLIGNDSAPLHLAAGVGIPVLGIFGPTHPKATGPYPLENHAIVRMELPCSPCGSRKCRNPNYLECVQSISLDHLLREVKMIVGGFSSQRDDRIVSATRSPVKSSICEEVEVESRMAEQRTREKVSAVVIAYNDAPNMRKCLESLQWVDELVVVDSHSTDGTTDICREFTTNIFHYPFQGFGMLRNQALTHATHDWVFSLDTDERVTPHVQEEIERLLVEGPSAQAYKIPRRNYFLGRWIKHCGWYPDYRQPQFFHKGHMRYRDELVHEGYELKGKLGYLHASLEQIPFRDIDHYFRKMDRYSSLRAEAMHREGRTFRAHQLVLRPVFTFLKMYVFRGGLLDRKPGLILSILYAYYTFVKYAKLWEMQKR